MTRGLAEDCGIAQMVFRKRIVKLSMFETQREHIHYCAAEIARWTDCSKCMAADVHENGICVS